MAVSRITFRFRDPLADSPSWLACQRPCGFGPLTIGQGRRHIHRYSKPVIAKDEIPSPFKDPKHPLDDDISPRIVHLVTPQGLLRNQSLKTLLRPLNPKEQNIRQVSLDRETGSPIVKIIARRDLQEQYQAAVRQKRRSGQDSTKKELELNWAIDRAGDLQHRLKKLKEWLAEGRPVEVLLAHKVAKQRAAPSDCKELIEMVREAAKEIDGVAESREMDGRIGSQVVLYFRPQDKTGAQKEALSKVDTYQKERSEKKAKREQEKQERKAELDERKRRKDEKDRQLERLRKSQKAFQQHRG